MEKRNIKELTKERYGKIARQKSSCCGPSSCATSESTGDVSLKRRYSEKDLSAIPKGANLGLGSGNPVTLASLREGETVLDLGSGAGIDCFLASGRVGPKGRVIGVDMTPDMIEKARENAREGNYQNVEFRIGDIENLPVSNNSVDVVISNCVINLAPNKRSVFHEAFRVLNPGGRLIISDIVLLEKLPEEVKNSLDAFFGCISGAMTKDEYLAAIEDAGFQGVKIIDETAFPLEYLTRDPIGREIIERLNISSEKAAEVLRSVKSMHICGEKPRGERERA